MADIKGTIDTEAIYKAHRYMRQMVSDFHKSQQEVNRITQNVKDNWVGDGRNAFESQYKILISKIDDFGDTIEEIYNALVDSETQYETADNDLKQQFYIAMDK